MSETKALDLLLASEKDRSNLQAQDESFWSIEHLDEAATELAELKDKLAQAESEFSYESNQNARLRAEMDEVHATIRSHADAFLKYEIKLSLEKRLVAQLRAELDAKKLHCPSCGTELSTQDGYWYCTNNDCGQAPEDAHPESGLSSGVLEHEWYCPWPCNHKHGRYVNTCQACCFTRRYLAVHPEVEK